MTGLGRGVREGAVYNSLPENVRPITRIVTRFRPWRAARALVATACVALSAAGCQTWSNYMPDVRSLGVYKLDINQGNYVTQDMVDKLKVGQTRQQVRLALGTPLLTDAFHDDRWDYIYEYQRHGRRVEHRKFTAYFVEDKLARWEGDELPVSAAQLNRIAADRALKFNQNVTDERSPWQRFVDVLKGDW
jgi:outer membrane protein assembly factor BamE (lipoprotein component of BamABCDE complex)